MTTEGLTAVGPTGINLLRMDPDKWQEFFDLLADIVHDDTLAEESKKDEVVAEASINNATEELTTFLGWFK